MKFWKINCPSVSGMLDAWHKSERAGKRALTALRKSVGASDIGSSREWFTGIPGRVGFKFDGTVDSSRFTKPDSELWCRAKASAKDLQADIAKALSKFQSLEPVYDALKISGKQFDGLTIWRPVFAAKDGVWYFSGRDVYKGCALVERITDVEMERLFPKKRKQTA